MGFFDARCMVTGVSLKGSSAALVLLMESAEAWQPVACAVKGSYNRLGAIDQVEEDANTQAILDFFLDRLQTGEFVVDVPYLCDHHIYPIRNIEQLLGAFERNINDHPAAAVLHDQPVKFALICRAVWDAIAEARVSPASPAGALVLHAVNIYGSNVESVAGHMRELSTVRDFMLRRKLRWQPTENPEQHYREEMIEFLAGGKRTFKDSPVVLKGLDRYERAVEGLLRDE